MRCGFRVILHLTRRTEESQALNRIKSGAIIIAGSGVGNGGRTVHHLTHNLRRRECHVMIVGYQANSTLGRRLVNREETVRILGETYRVAAQIHTVGGLSAHADQQDLPGWAEGFGTGPRVCVVHGEEEPKSVFGRLLGERLHLPAPGTCGGLR